MVNSVTSTSKPGSKSVLARILDDAVVRRRAGEQVLAVFDLDSTLFDLTLRISKIIQDFETDPTRLAKFPRECEALKSFVLYPHEWGLMEGLARI
ncbi:MAG: hypothetical protein V4692_16140, partial [Bdellovibrionota bacterium]